MNEINLGENMKNYILVIDEGTTGGSRADL